MRLAALALILAGLVPAARAEDAPPKFLVIVCDGLRPDYITTEVMPTLYKLGQDGVFFENHHSVIPTVTRVNAASFATGSYPETHGLMGNSVYFPAVDPNKSLNTSDYKNLVAIKDAEHGALLTATTIGEVLEKAGKKYLAVSSGSSGSAFLLNPNLNSGGVINVDVILPESQSAHVLEKVGPVPPDALPATARMAWAVDAYLKIGLDEMQVDVAFLWLTDPDHTAHSAGIGAPKTVESLRAVDAEIARILEAHTSRGLDSRINVMVTSDHGFSTHIGGFNLPALLKEHNLLDGVHIADGAIYVDGHNKDQIERIVDALQRDPAVGSIFTDASKFESVEGWVRGTHAMNIIAWQHGRSSDILVFPKWDSDENPAGFKGRSTYGGVAGHGSTSPWDIHNTLIAIGPAFKTKLRSAVPSANPDLAPTVLHILGIAPPQTMWGRPLREALLNGPDPSSVPVNSAEHSVERRLLDADGKDVGQTYTSRVGVSTVEGQIYILYIDQAETRR